MEGKRCAVQSKTVRGRDNNRPLSHHLVYCRMKEKMKIANFGLLLGLITATGAEENPGQVEQELVSLNSVETDSALDDTDLVLAFVVGFIKLVFRDSVLLSTFSVASVTMYPKK